MNEDITGRQQSPARTLEVFAPGDTAGEIELAALDGARAFFGDSPQLEIVPDYRASAPAGAALQDRMNGKTHYATVTVRVIEPR